MNNSMKNFEAKEVKNASVLKGGHRGLAKAHAKARKSH
jgi:hypothetical protein